jgi:hypothetical protein
MFIPDLNFFIQDPGSRSKILLDPGSRSASKNLSVFFFNPKTVSELWENFLTQKLFLSSGKMFLDVHPDSQIPDRFFPSRIRIPDTGVKKEPFPGFRIPDTDPQPCF